MIFNTKKMRYIILLLCFMLIIQANANNITDAPTVSPTVNSTNAPTDAPTTSPTANSTDAPTDAPTVSPTVNSTDAPTVSPTVNSTNAPTVSPTSAPTIMCTVGHFHNSTDCVPCPPGTYSNVENATNCSECQLGRFQDNYGSESCNSCPVDTFQNETGKHFCFDCPDGYHAPSNESITCLMSLNPTTSPTTLSPTNSPITSSPSISPTKAPTLYLAPRLNQFVLELLFTNANFTEGTHDTLVFKGYVKTMVANIVGTLEENVNVVNTFSGSVGIEIVVNSDGLNNTSFDGIESALVFELQQSDPYNLGDGVEMMLVEPLTSAPTISPTKSPTNSPTTSPTLSPTSSPTSSPTNSPVNPTSAPSVSPTPQPTTGTPTTANPTSSPTVFVHKSRTVLSEYAIFGIVAVSAVAIMVINIGIHSIVSG